MAAEFVASGAFTGAVLIWCFSALPLVVEPLRARFHAGWILAGMLAAIPTYLAATWAVNAMVALGVEQLDYLAVYDAEGYGIGWAVFLVCVQPAIVEEVAFRGIVQGSLTRVLGATNALLVCALMFAILHLSIPSLPHLLALGLALGWLRNRTNSLVPGMVLHFCHNFLVVLNESAGGEGIWPW